MHSLPRKSSGHQSVGLRERTAELIPDPGKSALLHEYPLVPTDCRLVFIHRQDCVGGENYTDLCENFLDKRITQSYSW
jgi:hypothetical protein